MDNPDYDKDPWEAPRTWDDNRRLSWEELTPLEREIKTEEYMLKELLRILKDKKDSYSILLMRLILGELKEPRL